MGLINRLRCFLIGLLYILILERFSDLGEQLRCLLLIGFLGGYTTFSSFSLETLKLLENGSWFSALLNILLSVVIGILLTWLGIFWAKQ